MSFQGLNLVKLYSFGCKLKKRAFGVYESSSGAPLYNSWILINRFVVTIPYRGGDASSVIYPVFLRFFLTLPAQHLRAGQRRGAGVGKNRRAVDLRGRVFVVLLRRRDEVEADIPMPYGLGAAGGFPACGAISRVPLARTSRSCGDRRRGVWRVLVKPAPCWPPVAIYAWHSRLRGVSVPFAAIPAWLGQCGRCSRHRLCSRHAFCGERSSKALVSSSSAARATRNGNARELIVIDSTRTHFPFYL